MTAVAHPLLAQPEGKTLEFKRDLSSPQNTLKTLVAFANSAGGRWVIRVDDARQMVGEADPLEGEERICNLIAMTLPDKPQSRLQRYRLTETGQALLAAARSQEKPAP